MRTITVQRIGDFYEAFGDDAQALRGKLEKVAGVPYHSLPEVQTRARSKGWALVVDKPTELRR